jgi:hypothetical protein
MAGLRELSESEAIGAACALVLTVPDGDSRCDAIAEFISSASEAYHIALVDELFSDRFVHRSSGRVFSLPKWFKAVVQLLLLRQNWFRLAKTGGRGVLEVFNDDYFEWGLPTSDRLQGRQVQELQQIWEVVRFDPYATVFSKKTESRAFGTIRVQFNAPDRPLNVEKLSSRTWTELREGTGIIRTIFLLLNFVRRPNGESAKMLVESVGGDVHDLEILPPGLRCLLDLEAVVKWSRAGMPAGEVQMLVQREMPGHFRLVTFRYPMDRLSKVDWECLTKFDSTVGVRILLEEQDASALLTDPEVGERVAEWFDGQRLMRSVGAWGGLFSMDRIGEALRSRAVAAAEQAICDSALWVSRHEPVRLRLPEEANLLPHLLAWAVKVALVGGGRRVFHFVDKIAPVIDFEEKITTRRLIKEMLAGCFSDVRELEQISGSQQIATRVRGAAVIIQGFLEGEVDDACGCLEDNFELSESHWYLPAAAIMMEDKVAGGQQHARRVVGELMGRASSNYAARIAIVPVLRMWRERSSAPVHNFGNPDVWK